MAKNKSRAVENKDDDFYLRFVTKDGSKVMDRVSGNRSYYHRNGVWDEQMMKMSLDSNSREKGVRVVSQKRTPEGVTCVVEWLKG